MEKQVNYCNVFYIKPEESKPGEEQSAEENMYMNMKKKQEVQAGPSSSTATANDKPLPGFHRYRCACAVVGLGLLTVLLLFALVALLVYYQIYVSEYNTLLARELHQLKSKHTSLLTNFTLVRTQNANLSNFNEMLQVRYENTSALNQHLHSEMVQLQEEKKRLIVERNHLNETLEVIFQYSVFPVCPDKNRTTQERNCSRICQRGWVYYRSSCYQFSYGLDRDWLTWEQSKAHCASSGAHLVVIETAEEQDFINNFTQYYYDEYHGYWIGLKTINGSINEWQWVNGNGLTQGYWIYIESADCALAMPSNDPLKSWKGTGCDMKSRWICEMEAAM